MKGNSGLHRSARVIERIAENPRTVTLRLDAGMEAQPGQFAMIWLPGLDEKPFRAMLADLDVDLKAVAESLAAEAEKPTAPPLLAVMAPRPVAPLLTPELPPGVPTLPVIAHSA